RCTTILKSGVDVFPYFSGSSPQIQHPLGSTVTLRPTSSSGETSPRKRALTPRWLARREVTLHLRLTGRELKKAVAVRRHTASRWENIPDGWDGLASMPLQSSRCCFPGAFWVRHRVRAEPADVPTAAPVASVLVRVARAHRCGCCFIVVEGALGLASE